jgi:hypothetical protein
VALGTRTSDGVFTTGLRISGLVASPGGDACAGADDGGGRRAAAPRIPSGVFSRSVDGVEPERPGIGEPSGATSCGDVALYDCLGRKSWRFGAS